MHGALAALCSSHCAVPSLEQLSTMISSIFSNDCSKTESTAKGRNAPPFLTGMQTLIFGATTTYSRYDYSGRIRGTRNEIGTRQKTARSGSAAPGETVIVQIRLHNLRIAADRTTVLSGTVSNTDTPETIVTAEPIWQLVFTVTPSPRYE
jgi:hypothetical protein